MNFIEGKKLWALIISIHRRKTTQRGIMEMGMGPKEL
jgi:hypothetical protein